ncbi:MAG: phosphatidylethanolamine N-methyltransferase family protein [Bacteroidota bacterium]|nr:phosphatidylethanolamine N-methyltransferase family protein [Bacteroidota bacterium]
MAIGLITLGLIHLAIADYNTWILTPISRIFLGLPIFLIGVWFVGWALLVMGSKNTLGIENGLITHGPYQFSRNPQYVGDILILLGSIFMVNSVLFSVPALLGIIGFWLMPLPEEKWMKERYGESYTNYKNNISRFI